MEKGMALTTDGPAAAVLQELYDLQTEVDKGVENAGTSHFYTNGLIFSLHRIYTTA